MKCDTLIEVRRRFETYSYYGSAVFKLFIDKSYTLWCELYFANQTMGNCCIPRSMFLGKSIDNCATNTIVCTNTFIGRVKVVIVANIHLSVA